MDPTIPNRKAESAKRSRAAALAALGFVEAIREPLDFFLAALAGHWRPQHRAGTTSRRSRTRGDANPAGSKTLRRFYRAKNGTRGTLEEARKWYSNLQNY